MNGSAKAGIPSINPDISGRVRECLTPKAPAVLAENIARRMSAVLNATGSLDFVKAVDSAACIGEEVAKGWIDLHVYRGLLYEVADVSAVGMQNPRGKVDRALDRWLSTWSDQRPSAKAGIEAAMATEAAQRTTTTASLGESGLAVARVEAAEAKQRQNERVSQAVETAADTGEQHRGQLRMAERMLALYASRLIFVHGIGWHEWDGARWKRDETGGAKRAAIATVKAAYGDLAKFAAKGDMTGRNNLFQDITRMESNNGLEGMLSIARALEGFSVPALEMDADPYLFNTSGGTLDLRSGEIYPARPEDRITKVAPFTIGAEGGEEFHRFLERVLPDPEVRDFVQRLTGYSMLGVVTDHVMPIFHGLGANGKGTLRDAVVAAFGDYAVEVDPSLLMESKHEQHRTFKMRLKGARMAFCSETDRGRRFNESAMKRLTGGDPIEANYMHRDGVEFEPSHTLFMVTNKLPSVSDDIAVWRRIMVVPFTVNLPRDEWDGKLPHRLKEQGGAVLAWALEGYRKFLTKGLMMPEAIQNATNEYRLSSDTYGQFFDECAERGVGLRVKARDLWSAWRSWCALNGHEAGDEREFAKDMSGRGFQKIKPKNVATYVGIRLRPPSEARNDETP
ncbi:phage/plasmid primase, P4 family [Streptomyces sp. NPDC005385]|uniref:DNA primase family protein n=1 Tax=Streptomyces sp. NPDC005385 TaxID=3157039 RepID=UPI00339EE5B9